MVCVYWYIMLYTSLASRSYMYEVISDFWTLKLNNSFFAGLGKNNIFFFFITSVHLFFTLTTVDDILELE